MRWWAESQNGALSPFVRRRRSWQLSGLIQGWARHVRKSPRQWAARGVMALSGSCVTKYAGYWPNDHGVVCYKVVIKLEGAVRLLCTNERPDFSPTDQSEASVSHQLDRNEVAGDRFRGTRSLSRIIRPPRSSAQQFYSRLRINKSPAWPGCLGNTDCSQLCRLFNCYAPLLQIFISREYGINECHQ